MRATWTLLLVAALLAPSASAGETLVLGKPVVMHGAAVSETAEGFVGSTATFTITAAPATNGTGGHVFLDTYPLTEVDMQGSARLAARVASQITGIPLSDRDLFFVIRSGSTQIGGPSAGATLTVGAIAALEGWDVRPDVLMTGTINPDGSVGPVGGIPEKAQAAAASGIRRFLFPAGEENSQLNSGSRTMVYLPDYCLRQLGMECVPVDDVYQAVANMTDHAFERPPVTGNGTDESFRLKLEPLSAQLVSAARALVDEAAAEVAGVPAGNARTTLQQELRTANDTLARATSASANGTPYTAASLSFQASIAAHDARDRAKILRSTDAAATIEAVLAADKAAVDLARTEIGAARVTDSAGFESVGAAQVRLLEAESRLAQGTSLVRNGTDTSSGIYQAGYAAERAETARWWLRLGADAPAGEPIDEGALAEAARDAVTTSGEQIAYVHAVFNGQNIGTLLDAAEQSLDEATTALQRGFYAAAMLDGLEAQVRSSDVLLLASFGRVPEARLAQVQTEALRAIQGARGRGVEPLLAQSEYEFAVSLDDPVEKLTFFGLARVAGNIAGLPDLFGQAHTGTQSRFQGNVATPGAPPSWVAATFAIGLALGAGAGVTAMLPTRRRAPPPAAAPELSWVVVGDEAR